MLCTGLMHTLYLIRRNFTFQVPSFDVAFLAKGCRPCCVQHSSASRELSKHARQCNVACTAMHTTGDNLHSCWWHDDDVYVSLCLCYTCRELEQVLCTVDRSHDTRVYSNLFYARSNISIVTFSTTKKSTKCVWFTWTITVGFRKVHKSGQQVQLSFLVATSR